MQKNLGIKNSKGETLDTSIDGTGIDLAKTVVVFNHGFGTDKHERGLFDSIVGKLTEELGDSSFVRFSYAGYGKSGGSQEEKTINTMAEDLCSVWQYVVKNKAKEAIIKTISFSMGNNVLSKALSKSDIDIETMICVNPAAFTSGEQGKTKWSGRPGAKIDDKGILHIPRADGSVTKIGQSFWDSLNPAIYKENLIKASEKYNSILIRATDDHVVENVEVAKLPFKKVFEIRGDHNFSKSEDLTMFLTKITEIFKGKKSKIIIVNENDEQIGLKDRSEVGPESISQVSAAWIINSNGESLLAKRAQTKVHSPGKWGPGVAGTVEEGQTYDSNIKQEIFEELGLKDCDIKKGPKERVSEDYNYFGQWYFCKIDKAVEDFQIQEEEVDEVKWFSKDELLGQMDRNPGLFIGSMTKEKIEKRINLATKLFNLK